jgi:Protein of unknown function (DUF2917)
MRGSRLLRLRSGRAWQRNHRGTGTWELPLDATLRVHPGRHGVVLRADRGLVLVTQAGDPEDHVLAPGQELRLPRAGLVAAWALAAARLVVSDAPAPEAAPATHGPAVAVTTRM